MTQHVADRTADAGDSSAAVGDPASSRVKGSADRVVPVSR
jgi:hypothetical protein